MKTIQNRPAESAGVTGALALLVARLVGLDDADVIVALGIALGFVPAAITWTVELIRGRKQQAG